MFIYIHRKFKPKHTEHTHIHYSHKKTHSTIFKSRKPITCARIHNMYKHIDITKPKNTHTILQHIANVFEHLTIVTTQGCMRIWIIAWPTQKTTSSHRSTGIQHQGVEENDPDRVKTKEGDPDRINTIEDNPDRVNANQARLMKRLT